MSRALADRLGAVGAWLNVLGSTPAAAAVPAVRRMEDLGFDTVWISEGPGQKEVLAHAATLLAGTERVNVGAGVASIYARDPMAAANGARALTDAYGGRFILGLGVSHRSHIAVRGHRARMPLAAMRSYVEAMRESPCALDAGEDPPIVLAGLRPRMVRLATELTEGVHTYLATATHTRSVREAVGDAPVVITDQPFVICDDSEGLLAGRAYVEPYLDLPNYRHSLLAMGFTQADLNDRGSDHLVRSLVAIGSPEEIAERIRAHHRAGADHVGAHPIGRSLPDALDQLELLVTADNLVAAPPVRRDAPKSRISWALP